MPPKPPGPILGDGARLLIQKAVEAVFQKLKARLLGPQSVPKRLAITFNRHLSLPGLFESAAQEERIPPNGPTLKSILDVAEGYLDATEARTKARIVKEVSSFLEDAHNSGTKTDVKTVLGGKLQDLMTDTTVSIRRIIDSEANITKNVSILDGIVRINAMQGIEDPVVYFSSVKDKDRCPDCTRLHCLDDEITPRVWLLSEVSHGYFKKGGSSPCMGGLHPHCFTDGRSLVLTEEGWKQLKTIKVGERVLTHNGHFRKVVDTIDARYSEKPTVRINYKYGKNDQSVNVTPDHKFLTNRGWVEAKDITLEDKLVKLLVPCPFCDSYVKQEVDSEDGKFKLNKTCGSDTCVAKLRSDNTQKWHNTMSDNDKAIRASKCSEGTLSFRQRTGFKGVFESDSYWTEERRRLTSDSIKSRMPKMLKSSASTRISRNQKLAYGWIKTSFPQENIEMEYGVGNYAIDIALPEHKIAIEIDGKYHQGERLTKDAVRDSNLKNLGWTVLRFGLGSKNSIKKSNIIPAVSTILSNHNGKYAFENIDILEIKNGVSQWNGRIYCLTVEEDESFIVKGIVTHNCRCTLTACPSGYGFKGSNITYISRDHDEYAKQHGIEKSESEDLESL